MKKEIEITGGLGNQMFQYSYARSLIEKGHDITLNISFYEQEKWSKTQKRKFYLDKFNIKQNTKFNKRQTLEVLYRKLKGKLGIFVDIYYENENYFKNIEDVIKKEFTLKSPSDNLIKTKELISEKSASIHVRRTDFLNWEDTQITDKKYFENALDKIRKIRDINQIWIFSDDIKWCKENLNFKENVFYASDFGLEDFEELILMSKCTNNIISNSTFSWWAAWLNGNPEKIVIAPKIWRKNPNTKNLALDSWIKI